MDKEEIRLKSLAFAFQYLEYYDKCVGHATSYKTEHGVISIAAVFEDYIIKKG